MKKKNKKIIKKLVAKKKKTVRPVVSRKVGILAKAKLLKPSKPQKRVSVKKKLKKEKQVKKRTIKKIVVRKVSKKEVSQNKLLESGFSANSFFKAKIKVIGLGGGGGSIVSEIGRSLNKATFVIADTDTRAFKKKAGIKNFLFGQNLTHGLGTGLDTEIARNAAEQEREKIVKLFQDQDIVIFIACLGGGLGSGATQVFAEVARDFGGISFGIFTLPFKFEGKNKYNIASRALRELRKSLNVSITIPNERIFKVIDGNTPITQAFSMVNKSLIDSLESLIDLIYTPGVINIDFADLRAILSGRGNLAFLNTVQASGKDRAEKIVAEIMKNDLYQHGHFTPEKILFNIAGGGSLSMLEVDAISRSIAEKSQKAKIIFGISKSPQLKNKIKTTLLMTGPTLGSENAVKDSAQIKSVIKPTKIVKKIKKKKQSIQQLPKEKKENVMSNLVPIFQNTPVGISGVSKLAITEESGNQKKAIRRTALEVKKAEEIEENKKSEQEKEWEIPAFLRFKK